MTAELPQPQPTDAVIVGGARTPHHNETAVKILVSPTGQGL